MRAVRRCSACGEILSSHSNGVRCQPCVASTSQGKIVLAGQLLAEPVIRQALADGDWQTVLRAIVRDTGLTQVALSAATGVSQPHLSRLMSGRTIEPGIKTVRALCDGLGIPRQLAGLAPALDLEEDTDRRQALAAGAGAAGMALLSVYGVPAVSDGVDEALLIEVTSHLRMLEQHTPARTLLPSAVAHFDLIQSVRSRTNGNLQIRRLLGVASEAAGLAAWLYADLNEQANARRFYRLAIKTAAASDNPLLTSYMRGSFAHFATNAGAPRQGQHLIAKTRVQLPRSAPPIAVLWLDAMEAAALAKLKDPRALVLLDGAERRLSKSTHTEPVWPWLFHFDEPKLAGHRAVAASDLGQYRTAETAFILACQGGGSPKQRAMTAVARASTLASVGFVDNACQLASNALKSGRRLGSERVTRAVRTFRDNIVTHSSEVVAELDCQLAQSYEEDL